MARLKNEFRLSTFEAGAEESCLVEDAVRWFELRNTLDAYEVEELDSFELVRLLPTLTVEWNTIGT